MGSWPVVRMVGRSSNINVPTVGKIYGLNYLHPHINDQKPVILGWNTKTEVNKIGLLLCPSHIELRFRLELRLI